LSFSSDVKIELSKIPIEENCDLIAELAAFVPTCGSLNFSNDGIKIKFDTKSAAVARRLFTFLKKYYSEDVFVSVSKSRQLNKNNIYSIKLDDTGASKMLLDDIDYIKNENIFIPNYKPISLLTDKCCKKAYIRAAFLGAGSVSDPNKSYHLEIVCSDFGYADFLSNLINEQGFETKVISRKESYIVYLKAAEQISNFLSYIGAYKYTLEFENVRVFKDINNQVNRIVNLENANLNKMVDAYVRQANDIKYIDDKIGIENLPENLQELARLRLENESISLKELGQKLNPTLGKSGVSHRLNKIRQIAVKLRSEEDGCRDSDIKK
jgi:DNA-binding protein WhiA